MRRLFFALVQSALLFCAAQPVRAEIQPRRFESGRISIDTSTGARCSSTGADRASFTVAGSGSSRSAGSYSSRSDSYTSGSDSRIVAGFSIPFGGSSLGNCNALLEHEVARSRLDLAAQLFEAGALSAEAFAEIAQEIADLIK